MFIINRAIILLFPNNSCREVLQTYFLGDKLDLYKGFSTGTGSQKEQQRGSDIWSEKKWWGAWHMKKWGKEFQAEGRTSSNRELTYNIYFLRTLHLFIY